MGPRDRDRAGSSRLFRAGWTAPVSKAPGRSTLTARLYASARALVDKPHEPVGTGVQAHGDLELDGAEAQAIASAGVAGANSTLPFLDQIQAAFGRHDVSGVRVQVGGEARDASAALGANAYTTGDRIGFARSPDLFLVAHEAAHVVQQRGGVQLSGGVGARGDRHEQHADAVAAAVVAGRSAESLLDHYAGSGGGPVLQRDPDDETSTLRISELRHLGRGRWVHRDGRPLSPRERGQLREALVQHARDQGLGDEAVGLYRQWLDNRANPPVDPHTWQERHMPIMRDHDRAWAAQEAVLPEGDPNRRRTETGLHAPQGEEVRRIPTRRTGNAQQSDATVRPLGQADPNLSFTVTGPDGQRVHRVDQQDEVDAPGEDACTTSGAASCAVTSLHHDAPGGDRLRLGHPSALDAGPQYDHLEESVVRAVREGGDVRGVVRIDPRAQQRPSRSDPEHIDDDFHTFPQSNDELRDRLTERLAREFGAENVSREGAHIVVRGEDGQVRSRVSIGIVRAPLDENGDPVVQHVTLTRNGTAIGNESGNGAPQTIPHDEAHLQGEPDEDAETESPPSAGRTSAPPSAGSAQAPEEPASAEEEAAPRGGGGVSRPARSSNPPASDAEADRDDEPAAEESREPSRPTRTAHPPASDAERESDVDASADEPRSTARTGSPPASDAEPERDHEAPAASRGPAVVTRPEIPVGGPPLTDAERERGAGLARNVRFALTRRTREGTPEERARAADGLRQLDTLGDEPHPEAVRRIARAAGVPAVEPDHEPADSPRSRGSSQGDDDNSPEVSLDGATIPIAGGHRVQVDVDQNGGSINGRTRGGLTGGVGAHVQHGEDGIEGGDVSLMAGLGDVRGTISAGVTYTARRPRRSGNRYSVSWKIEIRASAALHARLRRAGVGVSAGGAITREGTDLFDTLDAANAFRASFRELDEERIVERFFRTATASQGTHDWWLGQPTGTTRTVQVSGSLSPSIRGTLAQICEVGLSVPMHASASAQVHKTADRAVEVTESFEVGGGIDPSIGAAGIGVRGTLGTGVDNNVRYRVTYVFAVDLDAGRTAFERFLARRGLIWEGQAGVTKVSHSRTTETRETYGASLGPLGRGEAERGTASIVSEGADGERQVTHRGFQRDVYNDITGEYGRRGMEIDAPTDDRPYQIRTDIHSTEGDSSTRALGRATGTHDAPQTDNLRSSGNWVINEQLTQAQAAEFHRNFIRQGRPRSGWVAVQNLYRALQNVPTDASGRDARAVAISEFISHEGRRGLDFIYTFLGERPTQEVRLFTQEGEDTNFMREQDLRAMEGRIPQYEQAIAQGRGTAVAPRIQQDIQVLEPRLRAVSDRRRYTDLSDELRDRITSRYRGILDRLRPLYEQARSGQASQRTEARERPEFRASNLTASAPSPRLSGPDFDEDRDILDHIEVRGLHVLVDSRPFYLDAGIEVSVVAARRAGEQDGMTRFRVTLEIVNPMPGEDTIDAYAEEGAVPNRVGQRFHRIVVGRERDRASSSAPVQAKGALGGSDVHATAAYGLSGSGTTLPFLEQIQRAFGRHDVSGVRAHIGGAAAAAADVLGAEAYTTGDTVAFRGAPALHTAAHEAAHVIQQRAGVQLPGDVGAPGDVYERHADRVADAVVAGQSAEELLDAYAGATPTVQRRALQLEHRVGRNDAESVGLVLGVAQGDDLAAMRALYRALEQAVQRRTSSNDDDHVVCVVGSDDYDLVLSQESTNGLLSTLGRRMGELRNAAHASAVEQGAVPESRDDGMSRPDRDQAFASRFNVEFRSILPSLRQSDRTTSGDPRSPELTGEELRLMFSTSQREKLMRYFDDRIVPDRLFTSGDNGSCNAHQRIVISSHILSHGRIQEGSFAQDLHARYCGHWVQIVHAYAGVVDSAGSGVANQLDHDGNQVMATGRPEVAYDGARQSLSDEERAEAGSQRSFRQAALPVEQFDTLQPGDWLYVYTNTNTQGGNHSVVFSRWLGELQTHTDEATRERVQYRRAQLFGQQRVSEGGHQIEWYLGDRFTQVNGRRVYPITRVQRHDADEDAPCTPEDLVETELGRQPGQSGRATLLLELGTGPSAQANFNTIAQQERRYRGRLDLARLIAWLQQINAPMIDQLGAQGGVSEHDLTLMRQVNGGNDLDALIRLNERLRFRIENAEGLERARQAQAGRIEPAREARLEEVEPQIEERRDQIAQLNGEIDRARKVVDLDARLTSLVRERGTLANLIRTRERQMRAARRPDVRERMAAEIAAWRARKQEVEAQIPQLEGSRAEAAERERAGRVTTRIGNPAMRERLRRLEARRDRLEEEIDALQESAGYYTAHPGSREQLIGARRREDGEGTQRERITGRLTAVRPEVPWSELITPDQPGLAAEAQRLRREAQQQRRRSR